MNCRITRLMLAPIAILFLVLAGCSGQAASSGGAPKIGVVLKTSNDFFSAMKAGIEAMPGGEFELLGIEAQGDGSDAKSQIDAIENLVTRGADALVVAPVGPQVRPALDQAVNQGVQVVITDNELPEFAAQTSYVGPDNLKGGQLAGKYLKEQLKGTGKVAIMSGVPGVPALDARVTGMLNELKGTQIDVVTTLATHCDQTKGVNVMQSIASAHPDVDAIYGACGPPILGGIQARKMHDPFSSDLLLVGFDCLPAEAKAILAGDESASVAQFPQKMGITAVNTAVAAARGEKVPRHIDVSGELVTKANAAQFTTFQ